MYINPSNGHIKMHYITMNILIIAAAKVFAQSEICPEVKPVPNFNIKDLNGTWYEVARYSESTIETTANGSVITVNILNNGTVKYKLSNVIDGKANGFHGVVNVAPEAMGTGVIVITADTEAGINQPDVHLNILALYPEKYLILYDCQYDEKLKKRRELTWISARNPHVHQDIEDAINDFANSEHVIDNRKLLWERPSDHLKL